MISDNTQAPHLPQNAVKCRFFAQYWGIDCFQNIMNEKYGYKTYPEPFMDESNMNGQFCKLKLLSKITDEDAKEIIRIENFIGVFEEIIIEDTFLEILIDIKKGRCNRFSVIDFLRSKGYALPFMEYSVDDLISFGWVRLV